MLGSGFQGFGVFGLDHIALPMNQEPRPMNQETRPMNQETRPMNHEPKPDTLEPRTKAQDPIPWVLGAGCWL